MSVAKNVKIVVLGGFNLLGIQEQKLAVFAIEGGLWQQAVFFPTGPRPRLPQLKAKIGVQHPPKTKVREGAFKDFFQKLVAVITWPEAVAVRYQKPLGLGGRFYFKNSRFAQHPRADFLLKVVEHPDVVVARKNDNLNARVGKFGQFAQQAHVAARHHLAVFKPKVE